MHKLCSETFQRQLQNFIEIHLIHNEVKLQEENLKLAIVAKGPWRIRTAYKSKLQVSEEYCYQLNSEQRKR